MFHHLYVKVPCRMSVCCWTGHTDIVESSIYKDHFDNYEKN